MLRRFSVVVKYLIASFLHDVRALLDMAFEGDFTDEDWDHAIGGVHVWLMGSRGLISHGSLVERTLVCSGQTLRVGYKTLGWENWRGPTSVNGPRGRERTPGDDGDVMILRTSRSPRLDLDGEIVCDWRLGDVW